MIEMEQLYAGQGIALQSDAGDMEQGIGVDPRPGLRQPYDGRRRFLFDINDANFFGFALTKEEVLGDGIRNGPKPGWYFVLAEPSHEPRFGLDEPEPDTPDSQFGLPVSGDWNSLNWANVAGSRAALNDFLSVNLDASLPDTTQVSNSTTKRWHADQGPGEHGSRSSDLAYITLQRPMRILIHASEMIP